MNKSVLFLCVFLPKICLADCPVIEGHNVPGFSGTELNYDQVKTQISRIDQVLVAAACVEGEETETQLQKDTATVIKLLIKSKEMEVNKEEKKRIDALIKGQKKSLGTLSATPWKLGAKSKCQKYKDTVLSHSMSAAELTKGKVDNRLAKLTAYDECVSQLLKGLSAEVEILEKSRLTIDGQNADIAILTKFKEVNGEGLKTATIDAKAHKEDATLEDIHNYFKKEDVLANMFTTDAFYSTFFVGVKFSPEYDSAGDNQGFKETNAFGRFVIETRWEFPKVDGGVTKGFGYALLPGVSMDFSSANTVNCDNVDPSEKPDCESGGISVKDLTFNDISHTVNASIHLWGHLYQSPTKQLEIGPGVRVGMQSREKLKENGDSINAYHTVGLRFVYNDFAHSKYADKNYKHGMPRFALEVSYADFEDYAGTGRGYRKILQGHWRIIEDSPVYIGLGVNGGSGPDEISLTVSYGLKSERFLSGLTVN